MKRVLNAERTERALQFAHSRLTVDKSTQTDKPIPTPLSTTLNQMNTDLKMIKSAPNQI